MQKVFPLKIYQNYNLLLVVFFLTTSIISVFDEVSWLNISPAVNFQTIRNSCRSHVHWNTKNGILSDFGDSHNCDKTNRPPDIVVKNIFGECWRPLSWLMLIYGFFFVCVIFCGSLTTIFISILMASFELCSSHEWLSRWLWIAPYQK